MRKFAAARSLASLGRAGQALLLGLAGPALLAFLYACGGGTPAPKESAVTPGGTKDQTKWPADDRSMCDWKNKPELEVSETAGPGAMRPNVRRVYKVLGEGEARHKTLICREADTNLDGIKDVVRTFNPKGEALHEEADANYDGKIDVWIDFVDGRMSQEFIDTNGDGKPDVFKYYVNGALSRIKRDRNADGKPDAWEVYSKGHLERMGLDNTHDGHVDLWLRDQELQHQAEEEDIKAREAMQSAQAGNPQALFNVDAGAPSDAGAPKKKKTGK